MCAMTLLKLVFLWEWQGILYKDAYRVNPQKHIFDAEGCGLSLQHDSAEPSFSSCSFPCLLVNKPDGTYHFCFWEIELTKPNQLNQTVFSCLKWTIVWTELGQPSKFDLF